MMHAKYLTFEINKTCNLTTIHAKCPINDPERYMFGKTEQTLDDETILKFWRWARTEGFKGVVLWHLYNEPTLVIDKILAIVRQMKAEAPEQRTHLWTNNAHAPKELFDHVEHTNYAVVRPTELDNRRATTRGEGRPYPDVGATGGCGRGYGWEVIIDHHGNWLLCCNDWRAEGTCGNIFDTDWNVLLGLYRVKAQIKWDSKESYEALPRLCRACLDVNSNLHLTALPPKGVTL